MGSQGSKEDRIIANKINEMAKAVFSRTLPDVGWENSKLIKGDIAEEVPKLKQQPGKDIVIYGSSTIVRQLTNLSLIDEYQLMVEPCDRPPRLLTMGELNRN